MAAAQAEMVHQGVNYDLEVDAGALSPLECAKRIQARAV
jgi:chloramphenicol 3-O phosphotransferase